MIELFYLIGAVYLFFVNDGASLFWRPVIAIFWPVVVFIGILNRLLGL